MTSAAAAGTSGAGNSWLTDPSKIVIPTYKSLKTTDYDETIGDTHIRDLLQSETNSRYLKNAGYDTQLFIRICVAAILKLGMGRSVGMKTKLFKGLADHFKQVPCV